jgi:hypothetical protein
MENRNNVSLVLDTEHCNSDKPAITNITQCDESPQNSGNLLASNYMKPVICAMQKINGVLLKFCFAVLGQPCLHICNKHHLVSLTCSTIFTSHAITELTPKGSCLCCRVICNSLQIYVRMDGCLTDL